MKKLLVLVVIIFAAYYSARAQNEYGYFNKTIITGGISTGYTNGFGVQGNFMVSNFAQDFPLAVRFGLGYSTWDPGDAWAARRIFINDNTNGVPQKSGSDWNLRLDLLYHIHFLSMNRFFLFAGPRFSAFSGEFDFVDGNEFFNVTSNQWGFGFGGESYFMLIPGFDLVLSSGFDYYLHSSIQGHDTAYYPNNENINPKHGYTYSVADQAINQPKLLLRVLVGFNYRF